MTAFNKDFVADFFAPINGTSDCSTAGTAVASFCAGMSAGDSLTLNVPTHTYKFDKGSGSSITFLQGVLGGITIVVNMNSAVFTDGGTGTGYFLAGATMPDDNLHNSLIASASPGATSVTLLTPAENSRFAVDQWILIAGMDLQGGGQPINPAWFEYRKVTAINAGTGLISFTAPLANRYLSTWPHYQPGDATHLDRGGPAMIYACPTTWDADITFNGGTFSMSSQIYCKARAITFNSSTVSSSAGIVPTYNQTATFNSCDQSACTIEVDKLLEALTYSGGSASQLTFQSRSCATNCYLTNFALTTCNGTPRNLIVSGGSIGSFQIGATGYGTSDSITCNNCAISALSQSGFSVSGIVAAGFTMTGGVIRHAKASGPEPWAVPGASLFFKGTRTNEGSTFRVNSVTDDGTDTIIATSLTGGFPNVPGTLAISTHPCPVWSGTGNTGCPEAVELSLPGAQGKPLYSYTKRTYTGAWRTSPDFQQWGALTSITVTMPTAYSGAQGTLTAEILGQFGGTVLSVDHTSLLSYDPIINLKQTGTRTILPGSVSGQAGDTLGAAPGLIWFAGIQNVWSSANIAGESSGLWPSVDIEIITDQGLARQVVGGRLGLRLHG